jgi:hypothetical protein
MLWARFKDLARRHTKICPHRDHFRHVVASGKDAVQVVDHQFVQMLKQEIVVGGRSFSARFDDFPEGRREKVERLTGSIVRSRRG